MFISFSYELQKVLNKSKNEMISLKHSYIGTEHFVLAILSFDNSVSLILNKLGIDYNSFRKNVIDFIGYGKENSNLFIFTPLFKNIIENAIYISSDNKEKELGLCPLFMHMISLGEGVAYRLFCEMNVDMDSLLELIDNYKTLNTNYRYLNQYGENLCKNDLTDKVLIGREKELERIIQILLRKNKCNPLLIGDAGVGKTAIVEELAKKIMNKDVPYQLQNKKIFSISMANLVSGTKYRGEFEEKLLNIIKELETCKNVILFIDEIHTLVGAGGAEGAIDASNIFKPALARGTINVIGATTTEEYKRYIEKDKALVRRFQNIYIEEPNMDDTLNILKGIKLNYEKYHNVIISDTILEYIIKLSRKFLSNLKEPDRSIDILDDICTSVITDYNNIEINNINLQKELLTIREKKNNYLTNNNYDLAINLRKEEKRIESIINENELRLFSKKIKKKITREEVKNYFLLRYDVKLYNVNVIKSEIIKLKSELKEAFGCKKDVFDDYIDLIFDIFKDTKISSKPVSFIISNDLEKEFSYIIKRLFNNIIDIDLKEYKDEYSIRNLIEASDVKNSIFESLKKYPQSAIVFSNYDDCDYRLYDFLKKIIKNGYIEDNNGFKVFLNNCLIVFTSKSIISNIGFMNKNQNNNYLSKYVTKVL